MRRIRIVATGGTIAGKGSAPNVTANYQAGALDINDLCAAVPGLDTEASVTVDQFAAIDSKDADPAFWQALAAKLQVVLDDPEIDGVVVTHGTDTLEETAYYLNLALKTRKPVVVTGAMRPATALSADGPLNLLNAVTLAADPDSQGRGVLVSVNHCIFGARDVTKLDTLRPDAFGSRSTGPLGLVQDGHVAWLARAEHMHTLDTYFNAATPLARVDVFTAYPGFPSEFIRTARASGAVGIVWAGTGNGTASSDVDFELSAAAASGVVVVRASRVNQGMVLCRELGQNQIGAGTLSPWKARVLLMLAIGAGLPLSEIRAIFRSH